jgi:hypothetical protein
MKNISLVLLIVCFLAACGGGGNDSENNSNLRELELDQTTSDKIDENDEVHMYHLYVDPGESPRTLTVSLEGTHRDSSVDFMLTVYDKDTDGNLRTIFGESAPEDVTAKADIHIDVAVNGPRHLYFGVRDFKGDDKHDVIMYRLKASFTDETAGNNTFQDAIELTLANGPVCYEDEAINDGADVDCFRFTVGGDNPAGVYRISAQFDLAQNAVMPVNLDLELYDSKGQLVQSFKGPKPTDLLYVLLPYLDEGTHFLMVADQGRDAESGAAYKLCIEPVSAEEVKVNDTSESEHINIDDLMQTVNDNTVSVTVTGSLEYIQDVDWYEFDVTPTDGQMKNIVINLAPGFENDQIPEALQKQAEPAKYLITVLDEAFQVVYSYEHSVLALNPNIVELGAGPGANNYITIKPVYKDQMLLALPYQFKLDLKNVSDEYESAESIELTPGNPATGKIFKIGDIDTYHMDIDAEDVPQILEVYFNSNDSQQESDVNYVVDIQWGGNRRTLKEVPGIDSNRLSLKSSYYITQPGRVTFTVGDNQNNDGSNVEYTITADLLTVADSVSDADHYHSEINENGYDPNTALTVIEYNTAIQPQHNVDTDLLRVGAIGNGESWTSPWITGFADYDGDRDIFELNFDNAIPSDPNAEYYFDIQIEMTADASPVEYAWALFRDRDPERRVIVERTFWVTDPVTGEPVSGEDGYEFNDAGEGIVAAWADDDLNLNPISSTIPGPGDGDFWVGSRWRGSKFYLSVNDFNFTRLPAEGELPERLNPNPDNDWGSTNSSPAVAPYRFRATIRYHEGCPSPTECN